MKIIKYALAAIVGLGLTLASAPQASAEEIPYEVGGGTVDVSFPDFRYPGGGCYQHVGSLEVFANDDSLFEDFWVDLDLRVTRNGEYVDGWFDTAAYSGSYDLVTELCRSYNTTGTYTISGTITFWDWDYNEYEVYVSDNFYVAAPSAATVAVSKAAYGAHGWKINGLVKKDGRPWAGKNILFQVKRDGSWRTVQTKAANSTGRTTFYYTPPRGTAKAYRLYVTKSGAVPAKATGTFYLKRR